MRHIRGAIQIAMRAGGGQQPLRCCPCDLDVPNRVYAVALWSRVTRPVNGPGVNRTRLEWLTMHTLGRFVDLMSSGDALMLSRALTIWQCHMGVSAPRDGCARRQIYPWSAAFEVVHTRGNNKEQKRIMCLDYTGAYGSERLQSECKRLST